MPFTQAIPDSEISTIKELYYKKEYSMSQIAQDLGVSVDAVVYVMRKHSLVRRSREEQRKLRFLHEKPSFILKTHL